MAQVLIPTKSPEDWKKLLAKPDLHWKAGYSAMTLARAWESGINQGFPPEVSKILQTAEGEAWKELRLLLAIPEYKVDLPGGSTSSQTDVVAIARDREGLVVIAVEGKVDEPFGETVGEKRSNATQGVKDRLVHLEDRLGLVAPCPDNIRYQLLHRTESALRIADDFAAKSAVMLIHSFSPASKWLSDFVNFASLLGATASADKLVFAGEHRGIKLYLGWCAGDQRFRGPLEVQAN